MAVPAPRCAPPSHVFTSLRAFLCGIAFLLLSLVAVHARWEPIPPEDLANDRARIDPEADVEILLRDVRIHHATINEVDYEYFVRAKIYSERGVKDYSLIELQYDKDTRIRDIAARTIKPDGTIVELERKDFFDREMIKSGADRVRMKSFSPAALEPGAIVEYTYRERVDRMLWFFPMYFQDKYPSRHIRYRLKMISGYELHPSDARRLSGNTIALNCPPLPMKADDNGYYTFEMHNTPASKQEPDQPPRLNCESSVLFVYSMEKSLPPKEFWEKEGAALHKRMLAETKSSKLIQETLSKLLAADDSEDAKLRKIYDFCRTQLINRNSDIAPFTAEQRRKFKPNKTATDTLKAGHGTLEDINIAFVALARAAGFDARFARAGDRSFLLFDAALTQSFMASDLVAVVRLGDKWHIYDPGVRYAPFGMTHWVNSYTGVLIAAPKDAEIILSPASHPSESRLKRRATLQLDADGTLEGDVTFEYTGHLSMLSKRTLDDRSASDREEYVRDLVKETLKLAELSDIKVENADDPLKPLKISFHLRVPEYADRTGSRIFFQPGVFQKNQPMRYTEKTRRTDLMFSYLYETQDDIRILPPEGYELEEASSPGGLDLGDVGTYDLVLGKHPRTGQVIFRRSFALKALRIPVTHYESIRAATEIIHERDSHLLTLRRKTEAGSTAATPAEPAPAATDT